MLFRSELGFKPLPEMEEREAIVLRREAQLDASGLPVGRVSN